MHSQPFQQKKGKNFVNRLKQKLKRGYSRKGKNLTDEKYSYYITLLQDLQRMESMEEKDILIENFLKEVKSEGNIKDLAENQVVSRMLDNMLPLSSTADILYIMDSFSEDFRIICCDPFASHVLQTVLIEGFKRCQSDPTNDENENEKTSISIKHSATEDEKKRVILFLEKAVKFTLNNLEEFMIDPYASHVLRSVLEICSGVSLSANIKSKSAQTERVVNDKLTTIKNVPQEFKNFSSFIRKIQNIGQLGDIITNNSGSAVLQSLLSISSKLKEENNLVSIIIDRGLSSVPANFETVEGINPMFQYYSSIYLIEELLSHCSEKQQEDLYEKFFFPQFTDLVTHRLGNIAVNALLKTWKSKEKFDSIFELVMENLQSILDVGFNKIVQSIVMACRNLQMNQKQCIKKLMEVFDCASKEKQELFAPLLIFMIHCNTYEESIDKGLDALMPTKLTGVLIVEEFLRYNNPSKIVKSILAMRADHLVKIACDLRGCHIFDVFMEEPCVGAKSKELLVDKLKGQFALMARDKWGSRSLEAIFENSTKLKTIICLELSEKENMMKETQFGEIIFNKFQIRLFKKSDKGDWEQIQRKQENKRKFLRDFMDSSEKDSAGRKKKKVDHDVNASIILDKDDISIKKEEIEDNEGENIFQFDKVKAKKEEDDENFNFDNVKEEDAETQLTKKKKKKDRSKSEPTNQMKNFNLLFNEPVIVKKKKKSKDDKEIKNTENTFTGEDNSVEDDGNGMMDFAFPDEEETYNKKNFKKKKRRY